MTIRTYSELIRLKTFDERFDYLRLGGIIGEDTFGYDRYLNQKFYTTIEWRRLRNFIITRDLGCDLGIADRVLYSKIVIHHLNPINVDDIRGFTKILRDPEYLITTSLNTHNAIHYGSKELLYSPPVERLKNDTCPWKQREGI